MTVRSATRAPSKPCSIEGCEQGAWARGWCPKHYERWRKHGDPTFVNRPREPDAPVVSQRRVGKRIVYFTATGDAFVLTQRVRGHENRPARRYGKVFTCEGCKKESFCVSSGLNRYQFCSHTCAGKGSRDTKLGRARGPIKVEHLDGLLSALIRSDGVCVSCGATDLLQCAHGFSRRYFNVRWDTRNAFCQCQRCHMYFTHHPIEWDDWLRDRWGDELYQEIRSTALSTTMKPDRALVRDALVAKILVRDVTIRQLPKTVRGWIGLTNEQLTAPS